ncbi:hypothetical protein NPIL_101851 [Nephila pilipes]|uniref:Uncharacterized protein n=1 Tax=Nephila pilipes TaxID=299642 RepID=A0A8X6PV14_NEPPI|nr:hypothetical protein NPIL_101851 [Nephila pilipes]
MITGVDIIAQAMDNNSAEFPGMATMGPSAPPHKAASSKLSSPRQFLLSRHSGGDDDDILQQSPCPFHPSLDTVRFRIFCFDAQPWFLFS